MQLTFNAAGYISEVIIEFMRCVIWGRSAGHNFLMIFLLIISLPKLFLGLAFLMISPICSIVAYLILSDELFLLISLDNISIGVVELFLGKIISYFLNFIYIEIICYITY